MTNLQHLESAISSLHKLRAEFKTNNSIVFMHYQKVPLLVELRGSTDDWSIHRVFIEDSEIDIEPMLTDTQKEEVFEIIEKQLNDLP